MVKRIFIVFILSVISSSYMLRAQPIPDSLFLKVGVFKQLFESRSTLRYLDSIGMKMPWATFFFYKGSGFNEFYAITAKHVIKFNSDSSRQLRLVFNSSDGVQSFTYLISTNHSNIVTYHPDSLIDIAVLCFYHLTKFYNGVHWFTKQDFITKEELQKLKPGQPVTFIGLYPDSASNRNIYYWHPLGTFEKIFKPPLINTDITNGFKSKVEIKIKIPAKGGISGGPALIFKNGRWKVLGIINCGDSSKIYCTPAYKILEMLPTKDYLYIKALNQL